MTTFDPETLEPDWKAKALDWQNHAWMLWGVLEEAYREDEGLLTWWKHPELKLRERYNAWLEEEEAAGR